MNPKSVNDLDPKLKETYERVMGTALSSAPTQPDQPQRPMQTTVVEAIQPVTPTTPMQQPVDMPNPGPEMVQSPQLPLTGSNPFAGTVSPPTTVMAEVPAVKKKNNFLMPVLFVLGGIIFFAAYAVIWAKVFGLF